MPAEAVLAPELHEVPADPQRAARMQVDARELLLHRPSGVGYWALLAVLAVLALAALVALIGLALGGPEPRAKWGYTAAAVASVLSSFQAMPIVAFISRLGRGYWGVPLRR